MLAWNAGQLPRQHIQTGWAEHHNMSRICTLKTLVQRRCLRSHRCRRLEVGTCLQTSKLEIAGKGKANRYQRDKSDVLTFSSAFPERYAA